MRTVLFLGAGASRPFGFPMTAEILPEILRQLRERSLFRPRGRGRPREPGASAHDELSDLLSRFVPALFDTDVEPPLITDLLSLVDHLLTAGNAPQPDLDLAALDRLRALLERAIAEVLAEPTVPGRADENEELLGRFVSWMHDRAQEGTGAACAGTARCATSSWRPPWCATCAIPTSWPSGTARWKRCAPRTSGS